MSSPNYLTSFARNSLRVGTVAAADVSHDTVSPKK